MIPCSSTIGMGSGSGLNPVVLFAMPIVGLAPGPGSGPPGVLLGAVPFLFVTTVEYGGLNGSEVTTGGLPTLPASWAIGVERGAPGSAVVILAGGGVCVLVCDSDGPGEVTPGVPCSKRGRTPKRK